MKNIFLSILIFTCFNGLSQSRCCPLQVTVSITGTNLDSLHSDSILVITPAPGFGIRLTKPPIIRTYHDGSGLVMASGEYLKIINEFGDVNGYGDGELSSFGQPLITPFEGIGHGSFFQSYYMPYNGQNTPAIPQTCTGAIYIWATGPITGGGPNAEIIITIWYEEIPY